MSPESIASISQQALWTALLLSAPLLGVALLVGVLVSVFQAATQINEMTLSFVPKVLAMALVLIVGGPWMLGLIMHFTIQLFHNIPHIINS